ncbi:tRNA (5-methylaminomethyl-2-thiouridine)(34)-methyltransferase MnmD [Octadecabacter sp. R77987]|uniref:tRNA (5-methylaminomethyl-2-thiouridine)(34)-methyltransferase MnmD n=1 Tax=Octadecabacter sp. R77987 TaxID=3093874 RepID=UPI00366EFC99
MSDQQAELEWRDGAIPVSRRFDDPYFSLQGGLDETRHVFLAGNDLPVRFEDGFHVAELGFGTGLNFLATLVAWRTAGISGRLHFTSFEAFPMAADDLARALAPFADVLPVDILTKGSRADDFILEVIKGDARETLPKWGGRADAWYLDGFSPAKNPELWDSNLMHAVANHTAKGGTAATYTAAGHVRRSLDLAGFAVERTAGFGRKRHMTRAKLI